MERLAVEVDMYELKSRVPTELERLGVTVRVQRLVAGDYDVGAGTIRRRQAHVPRDRPPYTYRGSTAKGRPGEALLCAIEGISVHHARLLLDTFGSVRRIVEANSEDWQSVRGIGPARAAAMSTCFDGRDMISLPPRQRRRARDRAT